MSWIEHAKNTLESGGTIIEDGGFFTIVKGRDRFPLTRARYLELCEATGRTPKPMTTTEEKYSKEQGRRIGSLTEADEARIRAAPPPPTSTPRRKRGRKTKLPEEMCIQVGRMKRSGRTYAEIMEATGLKKSQVAYILKNRVEWQLMVPLPEPAPAPTPEPEPTYLPVLTTASSRDGLDVLVILREQLAAAEETVRVTTTAIEVIERILNERET